MEKDNISYICKKIGKHAMESLQGVWRGQLDFSIVFI